MVLISSSMTTNWREWTRPCSSRFSTTLWETTSPPVLPLSRSQTVNSDSIPLNCNLNSSVDTLCLFVSSSDPINCAASSSSVCYANVGWLISSGNNIASFVKNATCSDGKSISAVNQASCSQTPTTQPTTRRPFKRKPLIEILAHTWVQSLFNSIFNSNWLFWEKSLQKVMPRKFKHDVNKPLAQIQKNLDFF